MAGASNPVSPIVSLAFFMVLLGWELLSAALSPLGVVWYRSVGYVSPNGDLDKFYLGCGLNCQFAPFGLWQLPNGSSRAFPL